MFTSCRTFQDRVDKWQLHENTLLSQYLAYDKLLKLPAVSCGVSQDFQHIL